MLGDFLSTPKKAFQLTFQEKVANYTNLILECYPV